MGRAQKVRMFKCMPRSSIYKNLQNILCLDDDWIMNPIKNLRIKIFLKSKSVCDRKFTNSLLSCNMGT